MTVNPIRPSEVGSAKMRIIPDKVIQCWNDMIAKHAVGRCSEFLQSDIQEAIAREMDVSKETVYLNGWLDIEDLFQDFGWEVTYDKPSFYETYSATFTFEPKETD